MGIPSGYTSAQVVQAVPTGINSALVLISSTTIDNGVTFVTVSDAFSSTYDNYKILINGGAASAASRLQVQLGVTAVGYYSGNHRITYTGAVLSTTSDINDDAFKFGGWAYPDGINLSAELYSPNLAKFTVFSASGAQMVTTGQSFVYNGYLNNTTQYTDFSIVTSGGTLTGGTIQVYGYTKG